MPTDNRELKRAGLKATLPRLKILEILETPGRNHLSAEDVYRELLEAGDDVGLATIYRVLTQFESAGLVTRHHFESGPAVFELERGNHHDHIICVQCGKVEEFYDQTIEDRQKSVVGKMGYSIQDHSLVIYGNCNNPNCPGKSR
ncbi:MAG: ferric iron uptake transcriptional regulator [Gammaproteobacteria bacterium]|nr:MAG: ferric iron uptake transcriptional regulator [Gammaproteobacteria bacterium]